MSFAENVAYVRDILRRESAAWGREPLLVAATKYLSAEEMLSLPGDGITAIGENRVQALRDKLPIIGGKFDIHFIGRLQSNKVKYIIKDVSLIHSLDQISLAQEIHRQAVKNLKRMDVLVEVNVTGEMSKGGVAEEDLSPFLREAAAYDGLRIRGFMAMMPLGAPRDYILERFTHLRTLLDRYREEAIPGTEMTELSMGMSQDYDLAARAGATMVRVGSALWQQRRT